MAAPSANASDSAARSAARDAGVVYANGGQHQKQALAAESSPGVRALLEACGHKTDVCDFHPEGSPTVYTGARELAGSATNCTDDKMTRWIEWSTLQTTKNSVGLEMSAEAGFGEVFKVGFKVAYNREWGWEKGKTDRMLQELSPKRAVNIFVAPVRQSVRGTYELHFGYRYYGHYYWYVRNVEVNGPADSGAINLITEKTPANC
ncbi:hypothetical protein [Wenjunlia tyrosinilytica]|uniref:hypothetical protein n=1 Tax=Wenjunlia tyrosinilytica TaxID=1544741 RepID=UPI001E4486C7|nr:hypothetical protein [Wenjunlia tyrosinilytica]